MGCADAAWPQIPDCPDGIPALFRGLLDDETPPPEPISADECERLLNTAAPH
ncbi:hypothetical protein [Streptomyces sp. V1I6]|uniref:hypothetical protein n=1 Tax=Streptomyces sp. V1I6 TaxID=3042273 RepID=UPI00278B0367|nr:hypothetical protein [Streptomyces sp. V1I6]MDQ0847005.1 hypothetical protein [Streptomyces sp. V1I6]